MTFDPKSLTDDDLARCAQEMRRRGHAVCAYDAGEILTMTDSWPNQPSREQVEAWFDRDEIEARMSEAVDDEVRRFVDRLPDDRGAA